MSLASYASLILNKINSICLVFLLAIIPLIVNPTAMDYWYKPKIDSIYALLIIMALAVMIRSIIYRQPVPFTRTPLTLPLIAYGISAVVSTIFSVAPEKSIYGDMWREEGLFTLISYIALVIVFSTLVETKQQLNKLLQSLIATSFLVALYGVLQYTGFNPTEHFVPQYRDTHINSTMGNPNFLGKFIVLTLPLCMSYFLIAPNQKQKIFFAAGAVTSFCALLLTFTRASWLGFCVSQCIFMISLWKKPIGVRVRAVAMSAVVFMLSAALLLYGASGYGNKTDTFFSEIKSRITTAFDIRSGTGSATRLFVWKKTIGLIGEHPFVGFGLDAHESAMRRFNLEYNRTFNNWVIIDRAHNNYLDIAVAQGFFGLGAYLAIIVTFLVWLWKALRQEQQLPRKIVYLGLLSAFCGYLVNDFFIFSVVSVSPTFWSLMGLAFSLKKFENP
jgi:putative inorganic carbon (HCO3(-)) transporter